MKQKNIPSTFPLSQSELSLCLRYSKNSSITDAIPIKILPESEVFERILVKDFY